MCSAVPGMLSGDHHSAGRETPRLCRSLAASSILHSRDILGAKRAMGRISLLS